LYKRKLSSPVKRVEFPCDRMSCITVRDRWFDIVLNVHAPTTDKNGGTKDRFNEELERVLGQFRKYCMKILLGVFSAICEEKIFSDQQSGMKVYMKLVMIMRLG